MSESVRFGRNDFDIRKREWTTVLLVHISLANQSSAAVFYILLTLVTSRVSIYECVKVSWRLLESELVHMLAFHECAEIKPTFRTIFDK